MTVSFARCNRLDIASFGKVEAISGLSMWDHRLMASRFLCTTLSRRVLCTESAEVARMRAITVESLTQRL